jgi:flagellar biogenesis protein FliO
MELLILLALVVGVVWVVSKVLSSHQAAKEAELSDAWRTVLSDSNYDSRRLQEERKLRG